MGTVRYNPANDPLYQGPNRPPASPFGMGMDYMNASDRFAWMAREQWEQWVKQFLPIENQLIDYASDVTLPGQNAERAISGVQDAFKTQGPLGELDMKTRGIVLNPDEKQAYDRERSLTQSLAEVQAANTARTLTTDRQRGILGAPINTSDLAMRGGR